MQSEPQPTGDPHHRETPGGVDDPATAGRGGEETLTIAACRLVQRSLLVLVGLLTLGAVGLEILAIYESRTIDLADILLMFLYSEVIAMVAVYFGGSGAHIVYPIFIAITALARLIVLQGKEMAPENIVYEAVAILLLAIAAMIVMRAGKS